MATITELYYSWCSIEGIVCFTGVVIRALKICCILDRNEYEISMLPIPENLIYDTRYYLKLLCDQVISLSNE
jgi:hypothetical protein